MDGKTRPRSKSNNTTPRNRRGSISSTSDRIEKFDLASGPFPELNSNLTSIAAQLTTYNHELQERTQEREELQILLKRLKTEVVNARGLVQKLQWSSDKTNNEVLAYRNKLKALQDENTVVPTEIKKTAKETDQVRMKLVLP